MSSHERGEYLLEEAAKKRLKALEEESRRKLREATEMFMYSIQKAKEAEKEVANYLLEEKRILTQYDYTNRTFDDIENIKRSYYRNMHLLTIVKLPDNG